ncbi:MAG: sigma 54-interacting transcriptional regulator [Phycisphaeraceae bacterium]|nr:RNA repair transcriptional activator RtcR [Phycisphaerales bacterium]MCB9859211.1 sigma 54-interacting transcriptional regulator [Phycisphaeraceae bacterium]
MIRRSTSTSYATPRPTVVVGLLGTTLDAGKGPKRWERWRPTVSLCQHEDFLVDRLELIHDKRAGSLADVIEADIGAASPETKVVRHIINMRDPWDFEEVYSSLHDFASSYPFDPDAEDYLFHITTGTHVAQICTFLLTEARYFPGKLMQTSPPRRAADGPGKFGLIDLDLSKYDRLASRFEREHEDAVASLKGGIETRNAAFNKLIDQIEHVAARTTDPMLITGPTGAGKSRLAGRIYELRKHRRLVAGELVEVNCATLRGDAAMSTLFGHKKGAFTGAINDRPGLLRSAHTGVLFLDEIGELGLDEQAMLLRALEEKRFLPLGADTEITSDFQLIAGTNRDLARHVRDGKFREDLLARINLWSFALPSLSQRPEDIEPNIEYELERFAHQRGHFVRFSTEAKKLFLQFATSADAAWTGNFRDLNAALIRMATLAPGGRISRDIVREEIDRLRGAWSTGRQAESIDALIFSVLTPAQFDAIDLFDRAQLAAVISVCRQSKTISEAGRALFAASRKRRASTNDADRLRKYLSRFDLSWDIISK